MRSLFYTQSASHNRRASRGGAYRWFSSRQGRGGAYRRLSSRLTAGAGRTADFPVGSRRGGAYRWFSSRQGRGGAYCRFSSRLTRGQPAPGCVRHTKAGCMIAVTSQQRPCREPVGKPKVLASRAGIGWEGTMEVLRFSPLDGTTVAQREYSPSGAYADESRRISPGRPSTY